MNSIFELSTDLVNHIAAGEVVDRPSSVLKELLENALDAGATKVSIRVKKGGIDLIEIADNGSGIDRDDLEVIASPHSTSKVFELEDLERIDTLGFRGEALASIAAVSKMTIVTEKTGDRTASSVEIVNGVRSQVGSASRERGTTVSVRNLFQKIPARQKFLKLPPTEYRKLVELFIPLALVHPEVHFVFESDGKVVYNLPRVDTALTRSLHPQRVKELFPHLVLVDVFYDGEGMIVGGFAGHPKHQSHKVDARYIYVNGRSIWDNGIARAVIAGAARFIPEGMKIPFFITLSIPHGSVDVNVHPRKMEVRFANPYRVYAAVEAAVKRVFQDSLREELMTEGDVSARRLRGTGVTTRMQPGHYSDELLRDTSDKTYRFGRPSRQNVAESLAFSKMLLEDSQQAEPNVRESGVLLERPAFAERLAIGISDHISAKQYLKRYLVSEINGALFIVDQHAAAERVRFEKLLHDYASKGVEMQSLMIPVVVTLSDTEALFAAEMKDVLETFGYGWSLSGSHVSITAVPSILLHAEHESLFREILGQLQEFELTEGAHEKLQEKYRDAVIATMACHSSVRMNQAVSDSEATQIIRDLLACENAYSCPHGRPIMWRVTPAEIDEKFNR